MVYCKTAVSSTGYIAYCSLALSHQYHVVEYFQCIGIKFCKHFSAYSTAISILNLPHGQSETSNICGVTRNSINMVKGVLPFPIYPFAPTFQPPFPF